MVGASCGPDVSETELIEQRKPEEIEEGMESASSRDASRSGVSMESVRIESRPCSKTYCQKEYSSQHGSIGKWFSVDNLPVKPG